MAILPGGASNRDRRIRRSSSRRRSAKIPRTKRATQRDRLPVSPEHTKAVLSGRFETHTTPKSAHPDVKVIEYQTPPELVTDSEKKVDYFIGACQLKRLREPHEFRVPGENGEMEGFRPDFYVPEYETYIDVTYGGVGRRAERVQAIKVARVEYVRDEYGVTIILIDTPLLARLSSGEVTVLQLIREAAEAQSDRVFDEIKAEIRQDRAA